MAVPFYVHLLGNCVGTILCSLRNSVSWYHSVFTYLLHLRQRVGTAQSGQWVAASSSHRRPCVVVHWTLSWNLRLLGLLLLSACLNMMTSLYGLTRNKKFMRRVIPLWELIGLLSSHTRLCMSADTTYRPQELINSMLLCVTLAYSICRVM
jgi:hypothetical protein